MKIAAIQLQPQAGNIEANIKRHIDLIKIAIQENCYLAYFPELSITGYEPNLAKTLAMPLADRRLELFQKICDTNSITLGIGAPLQAKQDVQIALIWLSPHQARQAYAKQILHEDECPFFIAGEQQLILEASKHKIAPAICFESMQSSHIEHAVQLGASLYLTSSAKGISSVKAAETHYAAIAKQFNIPVLMANSLGPCDNYVSAGGSAVWGASGALLAQITGEKEGVLIFDADTNETKIIIG